MENYRPILNLCAGSKIFERIFLNYQSTLLVDPQNLKKRFKRVKYFTLVIFADNLDPLHGPPVKNLRFTGSCDWVRVHFLWLILNLFSGHPQRENLFGFAPRSEEFETSQNVVVGIEKKSTRCIPRIKMWIVKRWRWDFEKSSINDVTLWD